MIYINYYIENVGNNLVVWKGLMSVLFVILFVLLVAIILRKRAINSMMMLKTNQSIFADTLFDINCSLHDGGTIRGAGSTSIYSEKDIEDECYYINVEVIHGTARMIGESVELKVRYKDSEDSLTREAIIHNNYMLRDELLDENQRVRIQLAEINVTEETVIDFSISFDYIDEFEKVNNWEYKLSSFFNPITT